MRNICRCNVRRTRGPVGLIGIVCKYSFQRFSLGPVQITLHHSVSTCRSHSRSSLLLYLVYFLYCVLTTVSVLLAASGISQIRLNFCCCCCVAPIPVHNTFLLSCALDFLTKPALPRVSHCILIVHKVQCPVCYVNQCVSRKPALLVALFTELFYMPVRFQLLWIIESGSVAARYLKEQTFEDM